MPSVGRWTVVVVAPTSPQALPFIYPQLHACGSQKNGCSNAGFTAGSWTTIRSAQDDVFRSVPGTGMAIAYDMGAKGVHSPHKQAIAHRLAIEMRQVAYNETIAPRGPTLVGACLQHFNNVTNTSTVLVKLGNAAGLTMNATRGCSDCCSPPGRKGMFHVSTAGSYAGEKWVTDADMAVSDTSAVVVTTQHGSIPRGSNVFGIRYAAGNLPQCAVVNRAGMPLAPFNAATIAPACGFADEL